MKLPLGLDHIERLTDEHGILEHCIVASPDKTEGYSTDDNARALQLALRIHPYSRKLDALFPTYLMFLLSARTPNGFHQDLEPNLAWKNDAGVHDGYGRAMHALAEAALKAPLDDQKITAMMVFDDLSHLTHSINATRTMAHMVSALITRRAAEIKNHALKKEVKKRKLLIETEKESVASLEKKICHLADQLVQKFHEISNKDWQWFEKNIAYDNPRMPKALFEAYAVTEKKEYLEVAKDTLDFLLQQTYDPRKDYFSFIGFNGWFPKNGVKAEFGQQPIEAGTTAEACVTAHAVTREKRYLGYAKKSFAWYTGKNILNASLVDRHTGGIFDGIFENGLNPNQGAESVLGYFLAWSAIQNPKLTLPL